MAGYPNPRHSGGHGAKAPPQEEPQLGIVGLPLVCFTIRFPIGPALSSMGGPCLSNLDNAEHRGLRGSGPDR